MTLQQLQDKAEAVSSFYAKNHHITRDNDWFIFKLQEELGEFTQQYLMLSGRSRDKGLTKEQVRAEFEKELSDVFGQLLLVAKHFNVDLEKIMEEKWFVWLKK